MTEYKRPSAKKPRAVPKRDEPDPVYVATGSFIYRFEDGTHLRLRAGVAVLGAGPGHLKELKKYGHIKEVK